MNTKHPKQLNTERKKKPARREKKTLTYAPKVKNYRALPEEKLPFINFQSHFLTPSPI